MDEEFSKEDQLELQRRRLADQVQESVEKNLIKRYTWLGIIMSLSIIAGVVTSIVSLTNDAKERIVETKLLTKNLTETLDKSKKSLDEVDNISNSVKDKFNRLDKDLAGAIAGKDASIDKLSQLTSQIEKLDTRVNNLVAQLNKSFEKQNIPKVIKHPEEKSPDLKSLQEQLAKSKLTVYLQYYSEEDKDQITKMHNFLKQKGYVVPKIELVKHHKKFYRDIRYSHDNEEGEAQRLKDDLNEFIAQINRADIKFNTLNIGKSYPNLPDGYMEVWVYFKEMS